MHVIFISRSFIVWGIPSMLPSGHGVLCWMQKWDEELSALKHKEMYVSWLRYIDGLVQDCRTSIVDELGLPQFYTKPSIYCLKRKMIWQWAFCCIRHSRVQRGAHCWIFVTNNISDFPHYWPLWGIWFMLWYGDTIWRHRPWLTLVDAMACCLMSLSQPICKTLSMLFRYESVSNTWRY